MKVSIIISTRNRANSLPTAIRCAQEQTCKNIEIIIADDASSDGTQEVALGFVKKDSRIKYFRQNERIGIAPTWKKAFFEYATGDFITVLNDDDEFIDDEFIEKSVEFFKKYENQNVVCVFSNVVYEILKTGDRNVGYSGFPEFNNGVELFNGDKFIFTDNGSIYKKSALQELNLFNEDISSLDLEMLYKLMLVGNFCYLDATTYKHNLTDDCVSFYSKENIVRNFEATRWVKLVADFAKKNQANEEMLKRWQERRYSYYIELFFSHYSLSFDFEKFINNFYLDIKFGAKLVIYGTAEAATKAMTQIKQHRDDVAIVGFVDDSKDGSFYEYPIFRLGDISADVYILIPSGNIKSVRKILNNIKKQRIFNEVIDIITWQCKDE